MPKYQYLKPLLLHSALLFLILLSCFTAKASKEPSPYSDSLYNVAKNITNDASFERARKVMFIYVARPQAGIPPENGFYRKYLEKIVINANQWAAKNGTENQKRLAHFYDFVFDTTITDGIERIRGYESILSSLDFEKNEEAHSAYHLLKYYYLMYERYGEVLEIIPKEYTLLQRLRPNDSINFLKYRELADVFYQIKNYLQSIAYNQQFLGITPASIDKDLTWSGVYNNLGLCYARLHIADTALHYFELSKKVALKHIEAGASPERTAEYTRYFITIIEANEKEMEMERGNFSGAFTAFSTQIPFAKQYGEPHIVLSGFYNIAYLFFLKNEPQKSIQYLDSLLLYEATNTSNKYYLKALNLYGKCLLQTGNSGKAREYFEIHRRFSDSVEAAKTAQNYTIAGVKFNIHLKEYEVHQAEEKVIKQKGREKLLYVIIAAVAIILIIIAFYTRQLVKNRRKISSQNTLLSSNLKEKEILLQEIHHRVKNNLHIISGLLQLQSFKISDPAIRPRFLETQQFILSMSTVHEMLYQHSDLQKIAMQHYFNVFFKQLNVQFPNKNVTINSEAKDVELEIRYALIIGVLSTELITNSMKYAFPDNEGSIFIQLKLTGKNKCYFVYEDSGPGFDIPQTGKKITLGQKLVRMMAEQLEAEMILITEGKYRLELIFDIEQ